MKFTPVHEEHQRLSARMTEFAGWEMPLNYPGGILAEHLMTRKYGGLFDISHMGRFNISGEDALPFLQHVLTNNAAALEPGESQYTIIPTESGGAVDDGYLYRLGESEYLLVVNAANTRKDWTLLQKYRGKFPSLSLEDHTMSMAMLSLQGPGVKLVLQKLLGSSGRLPEATKNRLSTVEVLGTEVHIASTGYAGEPIGFELFLSSAFATSVYRKLLELGGEMGIGPAGLGARDTLRLEAGLPLYGHELGLDRDGKEVPIFAVPAARFAVSFNRNKGPFVARELLVRQSHEIRLRLLGLLNRPKEQLLVPKVIMKLALTGQGVARGDYPVYVAEEMAGYVTSGTMVPIWKTEGTGVGAKPGSISQRRAICMAYLDADLREGQVTKIRIRDKNAGAVIVSRFMGMRAAPYARPMLAEGGGDQAFPTPSISIGSSARNLVKKAGDNTIWRQRETINLIPSEQTPSLLVKLLTITDPMGRYAEHRRLKALGDVEVYYYQGTHFIADVEVELVQRMREFLGCSQVEVRLTSGQMANATVFSGLVDYLNRADRKSEHRRLRSVMNHHIGKGGHLSAQPMGALRDYVSIDPRTERWAVVNFPTLASNPYQIDLEKTEALIDEHRPELVILGKSMILHHEPVKQISQMLARIKPKPVLLYDAAHVFGLLGPYFQEPLLEGADLVTASTHKTFFGTQRGVIASNMSETSDYFNLWQRLERRAFPGGVSNHHLGTLLGLLLATHEMLIYGRDYQRQVISNAKAFALALAERGLQVEGDPEVHYTETHQVVLRVGYARGPEMADRLEENNIIVNYQGLPDDEGFTASSGLRMGVQEMTRFGMKETDFTGLATYLADVILNGKNVSQEISSFRANFSIMHYCLPEDEAGPLVDELLGSLIR